MVILHDFQWTDGRSPISLNGYDRFISVLEKKTCEKWFIVNDTF